MHYNLIKGLSKYHKLPLVHQDEHFNKFKVNTHDSSQARLITDGMDLLIL